jgi:hypothetical protein
MVVAELVGAWFAISESSLIETTALVACKDFDWIDRWRSWWPPGFSANPQFKRTAH